VRTLGLTTATPYASAPAVGAAGNTYFNTTSKALFVSDGTAWLAVPVVTTWTNFTLLNSCTAYGGGFAVPSYRKNGDVVECRGLPKAPAGGLAAGTTICTLPAGFRPPLMVRFAAVGMPTGATNDAFVSLTVDTGGNVVCVQALVASGYAFFDTIRFSITA